MKISVPRTLAIGAVLFVLGAAAGAQQRPERFAVGTASAARGQTATGVISVPAGSDAGYDIPVAVIHGARPGKVLALAAGSHGTEYASIIALERLIQQLDPRDIAGTVIIVPLINPASFQRIVPHLNPVDGKNMNRFFPGWLQGTQTERASFVLTREVIEKSDHVIDMHGGDIDESLRQYSYWTKTGNAAQDSISRDMVLAFGLDHIIISADRPRDPNASRYLENTATLRRKPSITVEAGRAGTVEPEDVQALIDGTLGVMAYLRMLERPVRLVEHPVWMERVVSVASEASGIFYPLVERGSYVAEGMKLGYITDYVGKTLSEARAPAAGIITFIRAVPSMMQGETIANIGVIAR
ncbi:MAG: succinylglutamate desuccinylase/aspartoacylase family protein [Gemmatimonadetes bacterium]|nr:succinylglutamate desuccinylase/aspartoacylase family protein [Gemmatimonadota bacterium]